MNSFLCRCGHGFSTAARLPCIYPMHRFVSSAIEWINTSKTSSIRRNTFGLDGFPCKGPMSDCSMKGNRSPSPAILRMNRLNVLPASRRKFTFHTTAKRDLSLPHPREPRVEFPVQGFKARSWLPGILPMNLPRSAARSHVAQVANLPYRRLAVGGPAGVPNAGGLSIRDTADCQSALQVQGFKARTLRGKFPMNPPTLRQVLAPDRIGASCASPLAL